MSVLTFGVHTQRVNIKLDSNLSTLNANNYSELYIVLGNESCDLDSVVSSIVYSIFLFWQYRQIKCKACTKANRDNDVYTDDIFVPVLNVDRQDYELKTEVAMVLREHGINDNDLVFRDDYDLLHLISNSKTKIILVDHHVLSKKDEFLAPYVTEIIDHRPMDKTGWKYSQDTRSTIEIVGSCCTLVAQRIKDLSTLLAKNVDFFNQYTVCCDLLHSTIILDTVNFSKQADKATPHDMEIVLFLESLLKPNDYEADRKRKLDRLVAARRDVSSLTTAQILRKDVKVIGDIFVPSFPILVKEFLQRPGALQAVREALSQRESTLALLLGMEISPDLKRDMAVFSPDDPNRGAQLCVLLESWQPPPFQLSASFSNATECSYYSQGNLTASRKQYIPVLAEFLNKHPK